MASETSERGVVSGLSTRTNDPAAAEYLLTSQDVARLETSCHLALVAQDRSADHGVFGRSIDTRIERRPPVPAPEPLASPTRHAAPEKLRRLGAFRACPIVLTPISLVADWRLP